MVASARPQATPTVRSSSGYSICSPTNADQDRYECECPRANRETHHFRTGDCSPQDDLIECHMRSNSHGTAPLQEGAHACTNAVAILKGLIGRLPLIGSLCGYGRGMEPAQRAVFAGSPSTRTTSNTRSSCRLSNGSYAFISIAISGGKRRAGRSISHDP